MDALFDDLVKHLIHSRCEGGRGTLIHTYTPWWRHLAWARALIRHITKERPVPYVGLRMEIDN